MPRYDIRGISVEFPYDAYQVQLAYMERVIQSLQEKKHALLESPTGTGKTLCLLCATLAWRQTQSKTQLTHPSVPMGLTSLLHGGDKGSENQLPPIIYASRTHSQLCQAMKEIKKTKYRVKAAILGSRQQQCSNPALAKIQGTAKNHACTNMVRSKKCHWYTAADLEPHEQIHAHASKIMDLEDLSQLAKKPSAPCPYYLSRKMAEISDIIFVPYNYLVDKRSRKSIETLFNHRGAVVIFDEAHNIEQSCSEAASFDLPVTVLSTAALELERAVALCGRRSEAEMKEMSRQAKPQKPQKRPIGTQSWSTLATRAATLKNMVKSLEKSLTQMQISRDGKTFPGEHIFKLLSDACITEQNWEILTEALSDAAELLVDGPQTGSEETQYLASRLNGGSCSLVADALQKAFDSQKAPSSSAPPYHKAFRVHIRDERGTKAGAARLVLSYWCFSPGIAMQRFVKDLQIQNVILTSGTLSPMDSFAAELTLPFPVQLENGHVITESQALVRCVAAGPTGSALDSSFKCRDDAHYKSDLGHAVVHFLKIIPGGVLMFFPSYIVLQNCLDHWKATKQGESVIKILHVKAIVVEPQNPAQFPAKIKEYQNHIRDKNGRGCILFAVCRGKVSEGIDFSDSAGRAVILAGIPYAQLTDPKVKLKRAFLDQQRTALNGSTWYCQTALRAVNQAMGRVIRHKDDFGAILLCDRRFNQSNVQNQLSKWLRGYLSQEHTFGSLLASLTTFFKMDRSEPKVEARAEVQEVKVKTEDVKAETKPERKIKTEDVQSSNLAFKRAPFMESTAMSGKKQRTRSPPIANPDSLKPLRERDVDPKAFLQEMKSELTSALYEQVRVLLAQLKVDKDVGGFQDALIDLLSPQEATQKLLSQFSVFIPASQRTTYTTKIQAQCQITPKSSKTDEASGRETSLNSGIPDLSRTT